MKLFTMPQTLQDKKRFALSGVALAGAGTIGAAANGSWWIAAGSLLAVLANLYFTWLVYSAE